MRVLFVSSLWPPTVLGGAELHASRLAEELRATGDDVAAVTLGVRGDDVAATSRAWPYPLQDFASQPSWKRAAFHARDQYDPLSSNAVRRAIADFRPDVVHSHAVTGMSVAALTAPGRSGVAHVHTIHDYWLLCQRSTLVGRDDRACAPRCRGCVAVSRVRSSLLTRHAPEVVTAVSEAVAAEHRQAGLLGDRIRVVRNPVEGAATAAVRRAPNPGGPVVFGYLGQLVAIKGVRTLLQAFGGLDPALARLVVAGRGPLSAEVERSPGVDAVGWVAGAEKEGFFDRIDCLVVPSEWKDPAPLVLDEARARRIPVIGADLGGIPELLAPASRPLVFSSGDSEALRRRLLAFVAEPARYKETAEQVANGWPEHLVAIRQAYADARTQRTGAR
jgi:glycosyltransferase involved in cell wall biosynthesis